MKSSLIKEGALFIGDNGNMLFVISTVKFRERNDRENRDFQFLHREIPEKIPVVEVNVICIDTDGMLKKRELCNAREYEGPEDDGIACTLALLEEHGASPAKKKNLRDFFKRAKVAADKYFEWKISELTAQQKRYQEILQQNLDIIAESPKLEALRMWQFRELPCMELKSPCHKQGIPESAYEF